MPYKSDNCLAQPVCKRTRGGIRQAQQICIPKGLPAAVWEAISTYLPPDSGFPHVCRFFHLHFRYLRLSRQHCIHIRNIPALASLGRFKLLQSFETSYSVPLSDVNLQHLCNPSLRTIELNHRTPDLARELTIIAQRCPNLTSLSREADWPSPKLWTERAWQGFFACCTKLSKLYVCSEATEWLSHMPKDSQPPDSLLQADLNIVNVMDLRDLGLNDLKVGVVLTQGRMEDAIPPFISATKNLTSLSLTIANCPSLLAPCVAALARHAPGLQSLELCGTATPALVTSLASSCFALKHLTLFDEDIDATDISPIFERHRHLESFSAYYDRLGVTLLPPLSKLLKLKSLRLPAARVDVPSYAFHFLRKCESLREIELGVINLKDGLVDFTMASVSSMLPLKLTIRVRDGEGVLLTRLRSLPPELFHCEVR